MGILIYSLPGSTISNGYNEAGREVSATYSSRIEGEEPVVISKQYHVDGRLKLVYDAESSITHTYNSLNDLVTEQSDSGTSYSSLVNYEYDPIGNVTNLGLSILGSDSISSSYGYDQAERLIRITTSDVGNFEYIYNPTNGHISSVSNTFSGINMSYGYDLLDRLTNITYTASGGVKIRSLEYAYNVAGMITNKTVIGGLSPMSFSYQYDSIDRLVSESSGSSTANYNYDLANNRTSVVEDGTTNMYTLGIGNRLESWGTLGSSLYDAAGNTTNLVFNNGNLLDLKWDERYRLINIGGTSTPITYGYDVLNRKISRTEGLSSSVEYYVYDDEHVIADIDDLGNLMRSYTYGNERDDILSMTTYNALSTNTYFYLKDQQNTVIALADELGNVVESYEYNAYGEVTVFNASGAELSASEIGNRYTFQGREIDWDTKLTYFRSRWYSSEIGRWLSKDHIGIAGGLNLFAFVENNPVNYIDPSGYGKSYNRKGGAGGSGGKHKKSGKYGKQKGSGRGGTRGNRGGGRGRGRGFGGLIFTYPEIAIPMMKKALKEKKKGPQMA
ncbi:MAG: RHS repeat-associated core domain-containing protein [Pontiella sp.]